MKLGSYSLEIVGGTETAGGYVSLRHGQTYRVRMVNHGTTRCDAKLEIDGAEMGVFRIDPGKQISIERPSGTDGCFTFFEMATPEAHTAGIKSMPQTGLVRATFIPELQASVYLASSAAQLPQPPRLPTPSPPHKPPGPEGTFLYSPAPRAPEAQTTPPQSSTSNSADMRLNSAPAQPQRPPDPSGACLFSPAPQPMPSHNQSAPDMSPGGTGLSGKSKQSFNAATPIQYSPEYEYVTITLRLGGAKPQNIRPLTPQSLANPVPPPLT